MATYNDQNPMERYGARYGGASGGTTAPTTFSQMQQQGFARPAPNMGMWARQLMSGGSRPPSGGPTPMPMPNTERPGLPGGGTWGILPGERGIPFDPNNPTQRGRQPGMAQDPRQQLAEALYGRMTGLLNNPSRYDADAAKQTFNMMNQRLGEEYRTEHDRLTADANRRGVYYTSAPDVGYRDLSARHAARQSDLASNIAMDQARTYGEDTRAALGSAMGLDQQAFQQALQEAMFNRQLDQDQVNFLMQIMGNS